MSDMYPSSCEALLAGLAIAAPRKHGARWRSSVGHGREWRATLQSINLQSNSWDYDTNILTIVWWLILVIVVS